MSKISLQKTLLISIGLMTISSSNSIPKDLIPFFKTHELLMPQITVLNTQTKITFIPKLVVF